MEKKQYLGDGVYASNDGFHVIVEADNECGKNKIYLDPSVLYCLSLYAKKVFENKDDHP